MSQVRGTHDHEAVKQAITKGIDKYNSVPNTIPVNWHYDVLTRCSTELVVNRYADFGFYRLISPYLEGS